MNYQQALEYIHGTYKFGSKLGLDNIKYLLKLLGNPHEGLKIIHIAGTNGKGSTASFIHQILKEEGYKVGLYTSPYLETFTERMRINGENIPEERLAQLTKTVKEKIEVMLQEGKNHPTEFEVVTAIGFLYYAQEAVDFVVLEVGMGGRLDATNVVEKPLLSVITPIGFDHMEYLGDTLEKIAFEKGGIIKEDCPAAIYPQDKGVIEVFEEICNTRNSSLTLGNFTSLTIHHESIEGQKYSVNVLGKEYNNIEIKLMGRHQIFNSIMALTAIEILRREYCIDIKDNSVYDGLKNTRWAGRLEILACNPLIIIDGAHNVHGGEALRHSIELYLKQYPITLVLGMLLDKDVEGFTSLIIPYADKVVTTKPNNPRALKAEELADVIKAYGKAIYIQEEIGKAIEEAIKITPDNGVILVAGSLYMIGEARKHIKSNH